MRKIFIALVVGVLLGVLSSHVSAQGGMSKATMKLLVGDLLEAGHSPQVRLQGGSYFVTVASEASNAATAQQVDGFADNRGVTARVLVVQFE